MEISVALGGGGARGNSHIGVLRVLERNGFKVRAVAGTSFGAIVGTMYAAGYSPDDIEAIFERVDQSRLYARLPTEGLAILGTAGLDRLLDDVIGTRTFEKLRIPCAVVATDIKGGREIVLNRGLVKQAVIASTAVPGVFPVCKIGDLDLVDGGAINPVPVSVVRSLAPSLPVVAVALSAKIGSVMEMQSTVPELTDSIARQIARLNVTRVLDDFLQSADMVSRVLTDLRLELDKPDVLIRPKVDGIGLLQRVDVKEVARLGEAAAEEALPVIRKSVLPFNQIRRRIFPRKS